MDCFAHSFHLHISKTDDVTLKRSENASPMALILSGIVNRGNTLKCFDYFTNHCFHEGVPKIKVLLQVSNKFHILKNPTQ